MSLVYEFINSALIYKSRMCGYVNLDLEVYAKVSKKYFSTLHEMEGIPYFDIPHNHEFEKQGIVAIIYGIKIICTSQQDDVEFLFKLKEK